ncbi:SMC-Scp complex subunit ScpB [Lyngbya sp. PCC 8106]|uniref:SMC-Scp complex subunit ScpB n=1 Tax=Lyngbya sp. (strain PCC 8106) TaxID=313612 RepID=UPI0000EA8F1F|nr:SMC-Scp complex subunit ScpB [Lyngbya sp. PCC 8106]EAW36145.1 Predicted transcriptional regulator [Lyngbya sp. PCC 8106]
MSILAKVEAILYLKGEPVSLSDLAELIKCDRGEVEDALIQLMSDYAHRESALEVLEMKKGYYALQLRQTYADLVDTLIQPELGVGALRTLAAIALNDGIAQTDLVDLRGSGAYQQVHELVELGFIHKRKQKDTRSYWLQVTKKFHQYFQVDKLPQQLSLSFPVQGGDEPDQNGSEK